MSVIGVLVIVMIIYLIVVWSKLNKVTENQTRLEERIRQLSIQITKQIQQLKAPLNGQPGSFDRGGESAEVARKSAEPPLPAVPEPSVVSDGELVPTVESPAEDAGLPQAYPAGESVKSPEPPASSAQEPMPELEQPSVSRPVPSASGQPRGIANSPGAGSGPAGGGGGEPPAWWLLVREFFSGPTGLARVGAVLVVAGLASLLAYALQQQYLQIPLAAWITLAAFAGVVAVVFGYRQSGHRRAFGLTLQGAGLGTVFLSAYAALRLFGGESPFILLAIMVLVAIAAGLLAAVQNSLALAVLALLGGFIAPLLVSGDSEGTGIFLLLGYYAVLDIAILTMAWYRDWRVLSWLGLAFTYGVGIFWGLTAYRPEYLVQSEVFVWLYFVLFMAAGMLFSRRNGRPEPIMLFAIPTLTLAIQAGLVSQIPYSLALSSLVIAAAYVGAGYWARPAFQLGNLAAGLVLTGAVFAAAAVPLALPGRWTALVWAAGGAAALAFGARQKLPAAVNMGILLELAVWPAYFYGLFRGQPEPELVYFVVVSAFMIVGARQLWRAQSEAWSWLMVSGLGFGLALAAREVVDTYQVWGLSGYLAAYSLALAAYLRWARWPVWPWLRYYFPLLLLSFLSYLVFIWSGGQEISGWWLLLWLGSWLAGYWPMRQGEAEGSAWWENHLIGLWSGVVLTLIGVVWLWHNWQAATPALIAAPALFVLLPSLPALRRRWPLKQHLELYYRVGLTPIVVGAALIFVWACFEHSALWTWAGTPVAYLPLLNPLDLSSAFFLLALVSWARQLNPRQLNRGTYFAGALGLLWLTAVTGRSVLNYSAETPAEFPFDDYSYSLFEAAANPTFLWLISVVWAVAALLVMLYSVRRSERRTWQAGLAILGLVMLKVVFVDLADLGALERGLSFLGVGVILLLIGYLIPIPPKQAVDE